MLSRIKNKSLLLDTCILVETTRNKQNEIGFIRDLYDEIKQNDIDPLIDQTVEIEFLRGSNTKVALNTKRQFLEKFLGANSKFILPDNTEIFTSAGRISNLYRFINVERNQISLADCLIAAQLKKYSHTVYLATINHADFPIAIFDRICLVPVDAAKKRFQCWNL